MKKRKYFYGYEQHLSLNRYRTEKKDRCKEIWIELKAAPDCRRGLRECYKVERKFGEGKRWHGLGRCRYVGLAEFALQGYLTVMVLHLKWMVKLLLGVSFRSQVYGV